MCELSTRKAAAHANQAVVALAMLANLPDAALWEIVLNLPSSADARAIGLCSSACRAALQNGGMPLRVAWLWSHFSPFTAFNHAVRMMDAKLLRAMLREHPGHVNARFRGESLLTVVANTGDIDLLECLLECPDLIINEFMEPDGLIDGPKRQTVVHAAVMRSHTAFLRRLLRYPAIEVNIMDRYLP